MNQIIKLFCLATLALATLASCTTVPEPLEGEYTSITPNEFTPQDLDSHVRWAGLVIDYQPQKDHSCFSVLSSPLKDSMRPRTWEVTDGIFIACKHGELDEVLRNSRSEVTLTGQIKFVENRQINNHELVLPVVMVDSLVVWPDKPRPLTPQQIYVPLKSEAALRTR